MLFSWGLNPGVESDTVKHIKFKNTQNMTDQTDVFSAALAAIKQDIDDFCNVTKGRLAELSVTIKTLTEPINNRTAAAHTDPTIGLYFDDIGAPYCATDGSLIFFSGIPRSAASVCFGTGCTLNVCVETQDGPSIYMAEVRAVILGLEALWHAGHCKVHFFIDSQCVIDLINTIKVAGDSSSLMTIKRQSDLTAELIDILDARMRNFQVIKTTKVESHCERAGLAHYLNARADYAATSCLREKYAN